MIGIGEKLPEFKLVSVKPGFNDPEESGESAFEEFSDSSFSGKWKVIYFYPKDFTFICPTEIIEFASINIFSFLNLELIPFKEKSPLRLSTSIKPSENI